MRRFAALPPLVLAASWASRVSREREWNFCHTRIELRQVEEFQQVQSGQLKQACAVGGRTGRAATSSAAE